MGWYRVINKEVCEVGVKLELNGDFTYQRKNCGGVSKGEYVLHEDSILLMEREFLKIDSSKYFSTDSIADYRYRVLENGYLLSQSELKSNGRIIKTRNRLESASK